MRRIAPYVSCNLWSLLFIIYVNTPTVKDLLFVELLCCQLLFLVCAHFLKCRGFCFKCWSCIPHKLYFSVLALPDRQPTPQYLILYNTLHTYVPLSALFLPFFLLQISPYLLQPSHLATSFVLPLLLTAVENLGQSLIASLFMIPLSIFSHNSGSNHGSQWIKFLLNITETSHCVLEHYKFVCKYRRHIDF